jgi:hypothetical protein
LRYREQDAFGLFLRHVAFVAHEPALVVDVPVLDAEHAHVAFAVERNVARIERVLRIGAGAVERAVQVQGDLAVDLDVLDVRFHAEQPGATGTHAHVETRARGRRGGGRPRAARRRVLRGGGHHGGSACACGGTERDAHAVAAAHGRIAARRRFVFVTAHT